MTAISATTSLSWASKGVPSDSLRHVVDGQSSSGDPPAALPFHNADPKRKMSTKILVAIWNWFQSRTVPYDPNLRLHALEQAVRRTQVHLEAARRTHGVGRHNPVEAIFLAPEYFFTSPYSGLWPLGRGLQCGMFDVVRAKLSEISARYPDILIVPGTISWMDVVDMDQINRQAQTYLRFSERVMGISGRTAVDHLINEVCANIRIDRIGLLYPVSMSPPHAMQINYAMASDWRHRNPLMWAYALSTISDRLPKRGFSGYGHVSDLAKEIETVRNLPGSVAWGLRNTAVVFLGGREVYRYSKRAGCYETLNHAPDTIFMRGEESPVEEIEALQMGFEICLDHVQDSLSTFIPEKKRGRLDLHIVLSDNVENRGDVGNVLREGGYRLHASTESADYGVWKKEDGLLRPQMPIANEVLMGRDLTMWVIRLHGVPEVDRPGKKAAPRNARVHRSPTATQS